MPPHPHGPLDRISHVGIHISPARASLHAAACPRPRALCVCVRDARAPTSPRTSLTHARARASSTHTVILLPRSLATSSVPYARYPRLSVSLSLCLSVSLSLCLSVSLSLCLAVSLSLCLSVFHTRAQRYSRCGPPSSTSGSESEEGGSSSQTREEGSSDEGGVDVNTSDSNESSPSSSSPSDDEDSDWAREEGLDDRGLMYVYGGEDSEELERVLVDEDFPGRRKCKKRRRVMVIESSSSSEEEEDGGGADPVRSSGAGHASEDAENEVGEDGDVEEDEDGDGDEDGNKDEAGPGRGKRKKRTEGKKAGGEEERAQTRSRLQRFLNAKNATERKEQREFKREMNGLLAESRAIRGVEDEERGPAAVVAAGENNLSEGSGVDSGAPEGQDDDGLVQRPARERQVGAEDV